MAIKPGKGDIESQLDRLGQLLNELPEGRREAFFGWLKDGEEPPPSSKRPGPVGSDAALPSHGAIRLAGKKRSTSIAISEILLVALKEYSLKQGIRLSISALVELLIWQFLGSPTELIEKIPQAYRPRSLNVKEPQEDFLTAVTINSINTILGGPIDSRTDDDTTDKETD